MPEDNNNGSNILKMAAAKPLSAFVILAVFAAGLVLGHYAWPGGLTLSIPQDKPADSQDGQRNFSFATYWQAWDKLHEKFNGQLDDNKLNYGAVQGMVSAAGDPYTVFADPDATKQFEETIGGSFSGVGIELGIRGGLITVISPLDGSPAQKAGVREGDVITAVDGKQFTQDTSLDEAVRKIRGPRGSKVTLTVIHKNGRETTDIEITRDKIDVTSVKYKVLDNNLAHVVISSFNGDTTKQFNDIARQVLDAKAQGIILDLRNNPGGYLQSSVSIASRFIPQGKIVVSERGKSDTTYTAEGNAQLNGLPIVVLVNDGSASASEILAGALRDNLRVKLIGTKTFGKGSVQEMVNLDDKSSLRITVAKWFTPAGHSINETGLEPDIKVEQDYDTEADEPLLKAQEEITKLVSKK